MLRGTVQSAPAPARLRRRAAAAGLLLAAVTALLYAPVAGHPFILFDDDVYVTANHPVRGGLSAAGLRWAFTSFHAGNWHPLTWLSHMLDVSLFGLAPGPQHLVSVAWHCATAAALLLFLARATGLLWPSVATATLFALHPLRVESVAWVAERKDVLSGCFWMLTLALYLRYARRPGTGRYLAVLVSLALGLMAKPMLVTLPAVLLLLDWWPLGRLALPGSPGRDTPLRLVAEKVPLALLAGAAAVITVLAQSAGNAPAPLEVYALPARIANALVSAATYLLKLVWPHPLAVYYPHPGDSIAPALVGGSALVLSALAVAAALRARAAPYLAFGGLWYLVTLLPVSGILQVGGQGMADRYTYLPLVGVTVSAAWATRSLLSRGRAAAMLPALAAAAALALALRTHSYLVLWRDDERLFAHAAEAAPGNWLMHYNLGVIAGSRRESAEAIRHYEEAVRHAPDYADAHNNLGQLLWHRGRHAEARDHLQRALRLNPELEAARYNLGLLLLDTGDRAGALEQQRALAGLRSPHADTLLKMLSWNRSPR